MKIKNENGIKWISCYNLGELITEFKKFRNSKSTKERKNYSFGGIGGLMSMFRFETVEHPDGNFSPSEIIDSVEIYQENGVDLSLNLAPLNFREVDWKPYDKKVKNILKEIWETGEVKDYQCLDLNWPITGQPEKGRWNVCCDQCHKQIGSEKLAWFSDREKDLDFCSESCYSKFKQGNSLEEENKKLKEQVKRQTKHKNIWMVISIATVSIFILYLLFSWLKNKKLKKR